MLIPARRRSATAAKTPLNRNSKRSTTRNRWAVRKAAVAVVVASADKDNISATAIATIAITDAAVAINADADSVAAVDKGKGKDKDSNKVAVNAANSARHSHQSSPMVRR
jgi:hypothetical protein